MLGSSDQQVVSTVAWNHDTGGVEGLGVHQSINRIEAEFAELRRCDVARGQHGFIQILPSAGDVVVVGQHISG